MIAYIKGLAKPCMSSHPIASPTVCLVSIEVNYLTVTGDCSCLFIDRERLLSVNIVIKVVAVGFFQPLRLACATAKSSDSIIFKFLVLIQQIADVGLIQQIDDLYG